MTSQPPVATLPSPHCGLGLRQPHVAEVLARRPEIPWFEVHTENYLCGGAPRLELEQIRRDWPIGLHGVGLSLAGARPLDPLHLKRLCELVDELEPVLISEHLAWSRQGSAYLNDLLPIPYTAESLEVVVRNVDRLQSALKRVILIENPTRYLEFAESEIPEQEFLAALARRTGCGLLCDLNNLYVNCVNLGGDAKTWLEGLPAAAAKEIHLAGYHANDVGDGRVLIDDHGSPVADPVWSLYADAVRRFPEAVALIEWDSRLPSLTTLTAEAQLADRLRARAVARGHIDAAA